MAARFYVYAVIDSDVSYAYIGKGSGNRYLSQQRNFGMPVRILSRHEKEQQAFDEEVRLIARFSPPLNKHPGGQGGRVSKRASRKPAWLVEIESIGTREYSRRLLVRFGYPFLDKETLNLLQNAGTLQ